MKLKVTYLDKENFSCKESYKTLHDPEVIYRSPISGSFPSLLLINIPDSTAAIILDTDKHGRKETTLIDKHTDAYIIGDEGKTISVINRAKNYPDIQIQYRLESEDDWKDIDLSQYFQSNQDIYNNGYRAIVNGKLVVFPSDADQIKTVAWYRDRSTTGLTWRLFDNHAETLDSKYLEIIQVTADINPNMPGFKLS